MYRYVKGTKGAWRILPEDQYQDPATHATRRIYFSTVLTLDTDLDEEGGRAKYAGPLYFDIDAEDIGVSIKGVQRLVRKLLDVGVPESVLRVWASGKKGFHVLIPQAAFYTGEPLHELPEVYRRMAEALSPTKALDMTVYSGGKGRMWRLENLKREEGTYKVPLTIEELTGLTAERYAEFVAAPRTGIHPNLEAVPEVPALKALFADALQKARAKPEPRAYFIDPEIESLLGGETPPCMERMQAGEGLAEGFNLVAVQAVKAAHHFRPNDVNAWLQMVADSYPPGNRYKTSGQRMAHLRSVSSTAARDPNSYTFSCHSMRSVLKPPPCDGCPLKETFDDNASSDEEGLLVQDGCYWFLGAKAEPRRVTNFVLELKNGYMETSQLTNEQRRVSVQASVYIKGEYRGTVHIDEQAWNSKAQFLASFTGVSNAAFFGTDVDVQKLKSAILSEEGEVLSMGEVIRTHTCGIVHRRVGEEDVFVYVEPGWSVDSYGLEGTHFTAGRVPAAPQLRGVDYPSQGDARLTHTLGNLLAINAPHIVGQILGWFAACMLKAHLNVGVNQFPLLGLHGNAGSGKTMTASLMAALHGVDYLMKDGPITVSTVTDFALWSFCASSTTVPRILDEYNRAKMRQQRYDSIGEVFKAAWNGQSVSRGTTSGARFHGVGRLGATTVEIPISGPLVVLSEQAPDMPALKHRMVQVSLSRGSRASSSMTAAFEAAVENRADLLPLAKALYMHALHQTPKDVKARMDAFKHAVPTSIGERPNYSYRVVLLGLEFMKLVLDEYKIPLIGQITDLQTAVIEHLSLVERQLSQAKLRSEVDLVVEKLAVMAALSDGPHEWLAAGKHYLRTEEFLFLDTYIAHAMYLRYMSSVERQPAVIGSHAQFTDLLNQEEYCETLAVSVDGVARGRPMARLSLAGLAEKGVDVTLFAASM